MIVNVLEARNQLSALIKHVEDHPHDPVIISRRGVPVVKLVQHDASSNVIALGIARGDYRLPSDWKIDEGDEEIAAMLGV